MKCMRSRASCLKPVSRKQSASASHSFANKCKRLQLARLTLHIAYQCNRRKLLSNWSCNNCCSSTTTHRNDVACLLLLQTFTSAQMPVVSCRVLWVWTYAESADSRPCQEEEHVAMLASLLIIAVTRTMAYQCAANWSVILPGTDFPTQFYYNPYVLILYVRALCLFIVFANTQDITLRTGICKNSSSQQESSSFAWQVKFRTNEPRMVREYDQLDFVRTQNVHTQSKLAVLWKANSEE